uniref:21S rRNA pseudouridine(2819) synthase n=1 Tax=Mycena chlorophos TaxID=658473 RepID=A0ABQ0KZB0_MYCCL|nr:pseudouridine synthase [Mycena chlorophos]
MSVLYADRALVVLNKAPGLVIQSHEFLDVLHDVKRRLRLAELPLRVHRLDKPTTGCLALARSKTHARELSTQFKQHIADKTYLAVVRGGLQSFGGRTKGTIRVPLQYDDGRASIVPLNAPKREDHREAVTDWELVASSSRLPLSLLRLNLRTGNKHQLRVHLTGGLQTPILGDTIHSHKPPTDEIRAALWKLHPRPPEDRLFLHASALSFFRYRKAGPDRRFRVRVVAPVPNDFHQLCKEAQLPLTETELRGGLFMQNKPYEEYEEVQSGRIASLKWVQTNQA